MDVVGGFVLVAVMVAMAFGVSRLLDGVLLRLAWWHARRRRRRVVRQVSVWRDAIEESAALRAMDRARREADRREGTL